MRSGNPGYVDGYNILVAYNTTNQNNGINFQYEKSGLYMTGRREDEQCYIGDGASVRSSYDKTIKFGIDSVYSCNSIFSFSEFSDLCSKKGWKNYSLFNFPKKLQYLGKFGIANILFLNDWIKVINDMDLDLSSWDKKNFICRMPTKIFFDVLISDAGSTSNPQKYILSARLSTSYE